jgi:hypothetical protein
MIAPNARGFSVSRPKELEVEIKEDVGPPFEGERKKE